MKLINLLVFMSLTNGFVINTANINKNRVITSLNNNNKNNNIVIKKSNSTIVKSNNDYLSKITLFDCIYTIMFGPRMSAEEFNKKLKDKAIKDTIILSVIVFIFYHVLR